MQTKLTDIFQTSGFTGSWTIIEKMDWIGALMQLIISAFCLIGLFMLLYQRLVTLLYLGGRTTFDTVHEIKQAGKGQKMFGMKGIVDGVSNGNMGTGTDAIVSFVLSLLPDVKKYSDYSDEGTLPYNLKDTDGCFTYIMKTAIPTICLIFFFSIGFSGTLFRVYGNVADAAATAADIAVDVNLNRYVERALNVGSNYQFGFGADGNELGEFQYDIAQKIYKEILRKTEDLSTSVKQSIGSNVDSWIAQNITAEKIQSVEPDFRYTTNDDNTIDYRDIKNLSFKVVINDSPTYDNEIRDGSTAPTVGTVGGVNSGDTEQYVHVFIWKSSNSDETSFFTVESE